MTRPSARTALVAALVALVAGCSAEVNFGGSANPGEFAEKLIEDEIVDQTPFASLDATCEDAPNDEPGTTFDCEATAPSGEVIAFVATIEEGERIDVQSTNVVTGDGVRGVEAQAVNLLETQNDLVIGAENMACGDTIVLEGDQTPVACEVVDPTDGVVYEAEVVVDERGDVVSVQVGDPVA